MLKKASRLPDEVDYPDLLVETDALTECDERAHARTSTPPPRRPRCDFRHQCYDFLERLICSALTG